MRPPTHALKWKRLDESELEKYLRRTQSTISDGMYEYRQDNIILLLTELSFRSSSTDKYFTELTRWMSYSNQELLNIGEFICLVRSVLLIFSFLGVFFLFVFVFSLVPNATCVSVLFILEYPFGFFLTLETFLVSWCDVRCDFRILKMMFGASLSPVVCRKVHV